jgi:hypothetical protein
MDSRPHDRDIFATCGTALGRALRRVVDEVTAASSAPSPRSAAVFCSPLDEAFAEASVELMPAQVVLLKNILVDALCP